MADEQPDPDALARRGEASAARHDFEHALADLSKAVELRPDDPEYLFQRALIYRQSGQAALARRTSTMCSRSIGIFCALTCPARKSASMRKMSKGRLPISMPWIDWLQSKPTYGTCWPNATKRRIDFRRQSHNMIYGFRTIRSTQRGLWRWRGVAGRAPLKTKISPRGLADCNKALSIADKKNPNYAHLFENRGLLELRQANYDKAIADFDAALKTMPKNRFRALWPRCRENAQKQNGGG